LMRFASNIAQPLRTWLTLLASKARIDARGVGVRLTREPPHMVGGVIYLTQPSALGYEWDLVGSSFLHELAHARDYIDRLDPSPEEAEARARRHEHVVAAEDMIALARFYRLPGA